MTFERRGTAVARPAMRGRPRHTARAPKEGPLPYLGGQTIYSTLLSINPSGTGPNVFESRVWKRSSPSIQQWPGGTRTVDSE